MTALTTRDALAKALAALEPGWSWVQDCTPAQIGWGARQGYLSAAQHKADALIASGAVIDAATLADDERWTDVLTDAMLDDGHTGFGDCRPSVMSLDVTSAKALRALAAALSDGAA